MLLQVVFSVIVLGILYKFVRAHGCGLACQRRPPGTVGQRDVREECTCVCATCPCSPLDGVFEAIDVIPETITNKLLEWVTTRYERWRALQRNYADSGECLSPIIIEQPWKSPERHSRPSESTFGVPEPNYRASEPNFRTSFNQAPETGGRSDTTHTFSACEIRNPGVTCECSKYDPSSKSFVRQTAGIKMDEQGARISAVCNKCKAKGLTCMRSCPKAKPARNVANNTDI